MTRTLLCFGDSNTHGVSPIAEDGSWHRYGPDQRWPTRLARDLGAGWHLVEEGQPGRTTVHDDPFEGPHRNGLRVLPALLESHMPIDVVVMMLGTNDLKARLNLPVSEIAKGVRRLALEITRSTTGPGGRPPRLVIVSPVPILELGARREMLAGGAEKSRQLANHLRLVAAECGAAFLDAAPLGAPSPVDGVHLPPETHAAIAAALALIIAAF